ncbi:PqiC family protein [Telmatospirillum sp.]|uniref:PqiC family protein n=1 Tax=Telmatospirillum sp. TaxID=2079197 RepID=UPI0028487055|nr:PqiC family protein [Telmatospirillum sp.]MDR3435536.1 PqiC family protein [Telmatospirillum sp.]
MKAACFRLSMVASLLAGLSGCGTSEPIRYYSLAAPAQSSLSGSARMLVEVLPVAVPERLNRTEMILTGADGRLDIRYADQWAAPVADEIAQVVDDVLWRTLGATDTYRAPTPAVAGGPPQYRLALHVERFEAGPSLSATVSASWTIRRLPQGTSATCRVQVTSSLATLSPDKVATALSQASGQVAELVADSLGRLNRDLPDVCPAGM